MDLDEFLVNDLLADHELFNFGTVVALKLDNLTPLVVGHNGSIATEVLKKQKRT